MHRLALFLAALVLPGCLSLMDPCAVFAQDTPPQAESGAEAVAEPPEETLARIRERLALEPDNATGQLSLGTLLLQQGRLAEARGPLERAVELAPGSMEAHATLAVVLEQLGELEAADQQYSRALEILPDNVDIRVRRAALRNRLQKPQEALADLEEALRLDPSNIPAIFGKGILLQSLGRDEEAIATMRAVEQQTSEPAARAQAHQQIGQWMADQGRVEEAVSELKQALAIQPGLESAQLMLANLAADSGRYAEAAELFAEVVESSPDNQPARFGLAVALLMTEQYPRALAAIEDTIARFPDYLAMQHMLARLLAACPDDSVRDGERALQLAAEVMQSQPGPQSAQTYAMALAEVGRFEDAASVQRDLIDRFEASGGKEDVVLFRQRLLLYEQRQPVRAPWLDTRHSGGA